MDRAAVCSEHGQSSFLYGRVLQCPIDQHRQKSPSNSKITPLLDDRHAELARVGDLTLVPALKFKMPTTSPRIFCN